MRQRIRAIVQKKFPQALREPRMRFMLLLPPLIQLLIFGYAANLDVESDRIAWMDEDRSPASRELLAEFQGSGRFLVAVEPRTETGMQNVLDRGQVDAVIRVLPGFARDIERGHQEAPGALEFGQQFAAGRAPVLVHPGDPS